MKDFKMMGVWASVAFFASTCSVHKNAIKGKAIRYQSQLLASPKKLTPFFSFETE